MAGSLDFFSSASYFIPNWEIWRPKASVQETEWKSAFGISSVKEDQGSPCVSKAEDVAAALNIGGDSFYKRRMHYNAIQYYRKGIEIKCNDHLLNAHLHVNRASAHFLTGATCCNRLQNWCYCVSLCNEGLIIAPDDKSLLALRKDAKEKILAKLISEVETCISSVHDKERNLKNIVAKFIREVETIKRSIGYKERGLKETESKSISSVKDQGSPCVSKAEGLATAFKIRGNILFKRQMYDNAIQYYSKGIEMKCKYGLLNANLYANRASAHFLIANYKQAFLDSTESRKWKPDYMKAFQIGAKCYSKLQKWSYCVSLCDEGLVIAPDDKTLIALRKDAKEKIVVSSKRS